MESDRNLGYWLDRANAVRGEENLNAFKARIIEKLRALENGKFIFLNGGCRDPGLLADEIERNTSFGNEVLQIFVRNNFELMVFVKPEYKLFDAIASRVEKTLDRFCKWLEGI